MFQNDKNDKMLSFLSAEKIVDASFWDLRLTYFKGSSLKKNMIKYSLETESE